MNYTWDPDKREKNIEKHGLDFILASELFDNPYIRSRGYNGPDGEVRWMATGILLDGRYVTAVYTMRDGATRMISLRRANRHERAHHQEVHG